jgi:predicted trehalose synthase
VDVTLRTNLNFYFVFDCQNQALLWVYLGSRVKNIYKYSLRGAQEATYLLERFRSKDVETHKAAAKDLAGAAKTLGMEVDALHGTLAEVRDDPYTKFLCSLWPEKTELSHGC